MTQLIKGPREFEIPVGGTSIGNIWYRIIRLLPSGTAAADQEPLVIGSGGKEKEIRDLAVQLSEFCKLPLQEPSIEEST